MGSRGQALRSRPASCAHSLKAADIQKPVTPLQWAAEVTIHGDVLLDYDPQRPMGFSLGAMCHASRTAMRAAPGEVSDVIALRLRVSEIVAICDHAVFYIPSSMEGHPEGDGGLDKRIEVSRPVGHPTAA